MSEPYDVIIIGAGPAGLTAGLYCAQAKLRVMTIESQTMGGKIMDIEKVENYPGFSQGISGPELGGEMITQAINYGMEIQLLTVEGVKQNDQMIAVSAGGGEFYSRTLIIAGGARPRKLDIPGEKEFTGRGVGYCALCEGGQFSDRDIVVIGGGDAGITDALYLSKIAKTVTVIEVLPELKTMPLLSERARQMPNIEILCNTQITRISGDDWVKAVTLADNATNQSTELAKEGILVRIGWEPETEYLQDNVPLDERGFVAVSSEMETEIPGIFAAGDIRCDSPMQISTATGDGTIAALSVQRYLREKPG